MPASRSAAAQRFRVSRISSTGDSFPPGAVRATIPAMSEGPCVRVAAAGDIHVDEHNRDEVARAFAGLNGCADVVLIAGDLTTHGEPEQGEAFVACRRETDLPVVAVLGNHDWHSGQAEELSAVLRAGDIDVLDGEAWRRDVAGVEVGVAGVKGFVGGFEGSFLSDFGEPLLRECYAATGREVEALGGALEEIEGCGVRIALMHYAPVRETLTGEPEGIWTFLGSGRL